MLFFEESYEYDCKKYYEKRIVLFLVFRGGIVGCGFNNDGDGYRNSGGFGGRGYFWNNNNCNFGGLVLVLDE